MFKDLVVKARTHRRFRQDKNVPRQDLVDLVELARMSPSGGNMQPLRFFLSNTPEMNDKILDLLTWAGYIDNWDRPVQGEQPPAYIVALGDKTVRHDFDIDLGIASQTIFLGAADKGYRGCMFGAFNRKKMAELLDLSENLKPLLVIAIGESVETVVVDEMEKDGDFRYWRDKEQVHHVPKRKLEDLIVE